MSYSDREQRKRSYLEQERLWQKAAAQYGSGLVSDAGLFSQASIQNMPKEKKAPEKGVLLCRGDPLPENWRGAAYTEWHRDVVDECWRLTFTSPWAGDSISVYLDMETHSGADVNKMAETYLEVINQRRAG